MYFFESVVVAFENSVALCWVLPFVVLGLFLSAVAGYFCKSKELYFALCFSVYGGMNLSIFALEMTMEGTKVCRSVALISVGLFYVVMFVMFFIKEKREEKKKRRAQILRKLQFTLPDKDNAYVQDRLKTAIRPQVKEEKKEQSQTVRLEHVRTMLAKIKNAPLTKAERMEAEEMSKLFYAYLHKNKWSANDVRMMNDLFSALLKLSAKYAV